MPMFMDSLKLSVFLAIGASLLGLILGVPVAYALVRWDFKGKPVVEFLTSLPVAVPGMVAGLALLKFFVLMGTFSIESTLLIGHTLIVLPYSVRIVKGSLMNLPEEVELAAQSLGANPIKTFFLIILPLIKTSLIAAFILMFIISFNNVPISLFLSGPGITTLPIVMMSYMEYYYDPTIAALSTLLIAVTLIVVLGMQKILGFSKFL